MLPGLDGEAGTRAERRLQAQTVLWLTSVTAGGQPQSSPVGYVWDGERFLILSQPDAPKVRNLRGNPRVALHLDLDVAAEDASVLTIEGVAVLEHAGPDGFAPLAESETAAYVDRHREAMSSAGLTPEETFGTFSTVIRVKPTRARAY